MAQEAGRAWSVSGQDRAAGREGGGGGQPHPDHPEQRNCKRPDRLQSPCRPGGCGHPWWGCSGPSAVAMDSMCLKVY